jgi:hypothetical protein
MYALTRERVWRSRWVTLNVHSDSTIPAFRRHVTVIQFFIIYVPSQQLQGQLQTQRSVDTGNYIMDKHNINSKTNYMKLLEETH